MPEQPPFILTVPLVPPGVNHYMRHTRSGQHYQTGEAKAFKQAVALLANGQKVRFETYTVGMAVYLGYNQRLDVDGGHKVGLDALQKAGVIHSDGKVVELLTLKRRDWHNPRTEFMIAEGGDVQALQEWRKRHEAAPK